MGFFDFFRPDPATTRRYEQAAAAHDAVLAGGGSSEQAVAAYEKAMGKTAGISVSYGLDFSPVRSETSDEFIAGLMKRDGSFSTPDSLSYVEPQAGSIDKTSMAAMLDELRKIAFSPTGYGDTGGGVNFPMVSGIPPFGKKPRQVPQLNIPEKVANITSPKAQLSMTQRAMSTPRHSAPGPSIHQLASGNPMGPGSVRDKALPGATKSMGGL